MTAADLLSARAVRERAHELLALAEAGGTHFRIDWARLPAVVDRVLAVTRAAYPGWEAIPYHSRWRHFAAGGIDRAAALEARLPAAREDRLRARFDLVITSVLLDAGAGPGWSFLEPGTGLRLGRSEGLAVASHHAFAAGLFSSDPRDPLRADAQGLASLDEAALARAFQVTADNPLVGLAGRVSLLRRLGQALPRPGALADVLLAQARGGRLPATAILAAVLRHLGPIWPGRHRLDGVDLGDVWPHPALGWVPLHKLSQWLSYSLIEPLEAAGVRVEELDALTGLAEYRNGGLFLDDGLLIPRDPALLGARHQVSSVPIVEWRALTVALLDRTADEVRRRAGLDARALPLAKVLEGGTWAAGRQAARERRPDGAPPLAIDSDGTVF